MNERITIGITGGSGSGKTYFMSGLASKFNADEICFISQDNYYKPIDQQPKDKNGIENFDLPEAIDHKAFQADLLSLKAGRDVVRKEYTFNNPASGGKVLEIKAAPIIVVEGLFIQYIPELEQELDLKIFIEAKTHLKLGRRIRRDQKERGYDLDDVLYRYEHHVMPVYENLIKPLKYSADLVIPNNHHFEKALHVLVGYLRARLQGIAY